MARPRACCSLCENLHPIDEDELASVAPTKGSCTPTPTPDVSHGPTSALATAFAIAPSSDNKLLKQFIKASLEAQVPSQTEIDTEPGKQPLKA